MDGAVQKEHGVGGMPVALATECAQPEDVQAQFRQSMARQGRCAGSEAASFEGA